MIDFEWYFAIKTFVEEDNTSNENPFRNLFPTKSQFSSANFLFSLEYFTSKEIATDVQLSRRKPCFDHQFQHYKFYYLFLM